jgi:transposase
VAGHPGPRPTRQWPRFDLHPLLHRLTGADLSQIDGLGTYASLRLVAEIGTDMRRWPTVKHFTSWLCLAPRNQISGGKLLRSGTPSSSSRAALILYRDPGAAFYTARQRERALRSLRKRAAALGFSLLPASATEAGS